MQTFLIHTSNNLIVCSEAKLQHIFLVSRWIYRNYSCVTMMCIKVSRFSFHMNKRKGFMWYMRWFIRISVNIADVKICYFPFCTPWVRQSSCSGVNHYESTNDIISKSFDRYCSTFVLGYKCSWTFRIHLKRERNGGALLPSLRL